MPQDASRDTIRDTRGLSGAYVVSQYFRTYGLDNYNYIVFFTFHLTLRIPLTKLILLVFCSYVLDKL